MSEETTTMLDVLKAALDAFLQGFVGDCLPAVPSTWVDSNPHSDLFD